MDAATPGHIVSRRSTDCEVQKHLTRSQISLQILRLRTQVCWLMLLVLIGYGTEVYFYLYWQHLRNFGDKDAMEYLIYRCVWCLRLMLISLAPATGGLTFTKFLVINEGSIMLVNRVLLAIFGACKDYATSCARMARYAACVSSTIFYG